MTCATIVSAVIATKPIRRSATSDEDVATLLPRSRAPRQTATAANPPVHASAPRASANGIAPSSGMPTIEIVSPITTASRAGTNSTSAIAPSSPELRADEARTPIERIQPGATTVSSSEIDQHEAQSKHGGRHRRKRPPAAPAPHRPAETEIEVRPDDDRCIDLPAHGCRRIDHRLTAHGHDITTDDCLRAQTQRAPDHHHVIVRVAVDRGVAAEDDDRLAGGRVRGQVVVAQHPEVHAVAAVTPPALPLLAPLLA